MPSHFYFLINPKAFVFIPTTFSSFILFVMRALSTIFYIVVILFTVSAKSNLTLILFFYNYGFNIAVIYGISKTWNT